MGFSVISGDTYGTVMHADNASMDGTKRGGVLAANGDLWIGSLASPHVKKGTLTSPDGSVTIGYSSPNITLQAGTAVPTTFIENTGSAVPAANTLHIVGTIAAAGTNPLTTIGAASTVTIQTQYSQAIAATDGTKVGLSTFSSSHFSVDATGFVTLAGGGQAIDSVAVQTGTSPIVPTVAGLITINGATVVAGTNPVRTDGTGANTLAVEVQISQAIASTDATKIGLCNFDSARFTVDANGFVSANGSGLGETITGNSGGALSPTAGNWNILGASTAAGTSPVSTSGAVSTLTINVQKSQAIASTDATKVGLANFNSAQFSVDANGFVSSLGAGFPWTDQGTSTTLAINHGYFATAAVTLTLPASPSQGDVVRVCCDTASSVVVTANTGQTIRQGNLTSSSAGTFTNSLRGDTLELVYRSATTQWIDQGGQGTWLAA